LVPKLRISGRSSGPRQRERTGTRIGIWKARPPGPGNSMRGEVGFLEVVGEVDSRWSGYKRGRKLGGGNLQKLLFKERAGLDKKERRNKGGSKVKRAGNFEKMKEIQVRKELRRLATLEEENLDVENNARKKSRKKRKVERRTAGTA